MGKPSNREFRDIFDAAAGMYDISTNSYALSRRIEFIIRHARGKCLEVGAGTGEIARALSKTLEVTATDISPKMVEEIRKKMDIPVVVCDAEALPFKDASFDTVLCGEAIYYLDEPERFIAEAHRILRPQGVLLVTFASNVTTFYDCIRTLLRMLGFSNMYFDDHMHHFPSVAHIRNLVRDKGFLVEEEKRLIVVPVRALDFLNRVLEKTPLKYLAAFAAFRARKI